MLMGIFPSAQIELANKLNAGRKGSTGQTPTGVLTMRNIPPFIPAHDIARGLLHGAQSLLNFAFMLAAMSVVIVVGVCYGLSDVSI